MFDRLAKFADAPVRVSMAIIFILSGAGKIGAFEGTQGYMEAFGIPGIFLLPTIPFEIGAGLLLLVGFKTRYVAVSLAVFSMVSALVFHTDFGDQAQQFNFLKNLAMAGGFILLAKVGAPGISVDQFLATRQTGAR